MFRTTFRKLAARALTAGICLAPLAAPTTARADEEIGRAHV